MHSEAPRSFKPGSTPPDAAAAKAKAEAPPPKPPYEMPDAFEGQAVLWASHPSSGEWSPAIVCRKGHDSVALAVYVSGAFNQLAKEGVRHITDPRWTQENGDEGVWKHNPQTVAIDEAIDKILGLCETQNSTLDSMTHRMAFVHERLKRLEEAGRLAALPEPVAVTAPEAAKQEAPAAAPPATPAAAGRGSKRDK
jgi:hypothetical protein